ncbi:MAG: dihydroorotate dehydrogenase electron transfer subunit [Candidatus Omnitrophica bacterium]|nr:dihydroorotate dehydrogenase electron transfer subunit [Candidatus Omnitrophota bacterium]
MKEKSLLVKAKIIDTEKIRKDCFKIGLEAPYVAKRAIPGQFVHVRTGNYTDPLLRRPLSIHRIHAHSIDILFNVVGKGTEILSEKRKGDTLDIIGPLGNGFKFFKSTTYKIIVAGGMGVAPLVGLAEALSRTLKGSKKGFTVIMGAKTKEHILCENEFKRLGADLHIVTEDGSRGQKAMATDLLFDIIRKKRYNLDKICFYAAGPMAMVRSLCRLAEGCSIESQVSLEERMGCGLGACLGCAIDTQSGYKRVCKDGPVFNMCEVLCE